MYTIILRTLAEFPDHFPIEKKQIILITKVIGAKYPKELTKLGTQFVQVKIWPKSQLGVYEMGSVCVRIYHLCYLKVEIH